MAVRHSAADAEPIDDAEPPPLAALGVAFIRCGVPRRHAGHLRRCGVCWAGRVPRALLREFLAFNVRSYSGEVVDIRSKPNVIAILGIRKALTWREHSAQVGLSGRALLGVALHWLAPFRTRAAGPAADRRTGRHSHTLTDAAGPQPRDGSRRAHRAVSGSSSAIARANSRPLSMQRWRMRHHGCQDPAAVLAGHCSPNASS
jgi:hypothetical protein